jgi:hypothetical protein
MGAVWFTAPIFLKDLRNRDFENANAANFATFLNANHSFWGGALRALSARDAIPGHSSARRDGLRPRGACDSFGVLQKALFACPAA